MIWFSRKVPKQTVFLFEVFKTCYASIEHKGFLAGICVYLHIKKLYTNQHKWLKY